VIVGRVLRSDWGCRIAAGLNRTGPELLLDESTGFSVDVVLELEGSVGVRLGSLGGVDATSARLSVKGVGGVVGLFAAEPGPFVVLADRGRAKVVNLGTGTAASCT
jgi:hypothetical protein